MIVNTSEGVVQTPNPASYPDSNLLESSDCPSDREWGWLYTMQPAFMAVICVLGVVGNAFVLCVFCLRKKRCTVAEIYLGNLAAADLVMVSCLPFWAVTVANKFNWEFGELLCRLVNVAISLNLYCSLMFLVLVSIDRYLALVKTMSTGRKRHVTWAKVICLCIWAFGFLMSLPVLLFRTVKYFPELNMTACYLAYPHDAWQVRHNLVTNIIGFLIPFVVIAFCSYHIIKTLNNNVMKKFSAVRHEKKATHMILAVLLVFFFCWIPFQIVMFLDTLYFFKIISGCLWEEILDVGIQISTYIAYSNSCLNPILYVFVGKHFRKNAKGMFKQILRKGTKAKGSQLSHLSSALKTQESKV
ncbi:B2 bradykinin receptor-like [Huso huso]|uniref:B2 bradykinin receptor n=1 Tax=Huso huso TaxID=61971 RepID=A0ABR0Z2G7_HUSHU